MFRYDFWLCTHSSLLVGSGKWPPHCTMALASDNSWINEHDLSIVPWWGKSMMRWLNIPSSQRQLQVWIRIHVGLLLDGLCEVSLDKDIFPVNSQCGWLCGSGLTVGNRSAGVNGRHWCPCSQCQGSLSIVPQILLALRTIWGTMLITLHFSLANNVINMIGWSTAGSLIVFTGCLSLTYKWHCFLEP